MTDLERLGGWPALVGRLLAGDDLSADEARVGMAEILHGEATPSQLSAFIVALRAKGETPTELAGMLTAVLDAATRVELPDELAERALDIVGTGGDRSHSVNISTMAAFVLAGGGVPVCKHGNRAASSSCGTADVLEELGVVIELGPDEVARCVERAGMGFCFAPRFHPAFRHAGPTRREIGVPTAFNLLGPMANPASVPFMVVGVGNPGAVELMAATLAARGVRRAWVVHGADGLDELSTTGVSDVIEVTPGELRPRRVDPAELGLAPARLDQLRGGDRTHNAGIVRAILAGERGAVRDIVVLNAAAGFVVTGAAADLRDGLARAEQSIDTGAAAAVLDALVRESGAGATDLAR